MKTFAAVLSVLVLALAPSSCAAITRDPVTGEIGISPDGAARDARAFAVIARGAAAELGARPDLQAKIIEGAAGLEALAGAWDAIANGAGGEGVIPQIDGVLAVLDIVSAELSPGAAAEWGPYLAAVRASLELAKIYSPG